MSLSTPSQATKEDVTYLQHAADPVVKPGDKTEDTLNITRGAIRVSSPDSTLLSVDDAADLRFGRSPNHGNTRDARRHASRSPAPSKGLKARIRRSWIANKGLALVLIAQLFGTLMNVTTRMLEMEGNNGMADSSFILPFYQLTFLEARAIILFRFYSPECSSLCSVLHFICGTERQNTSLLA